MTAKTEIEITDENAPASGCCGGSSCGTDSTSGAETGVTTVYQVSGMTCGHCEGSISAEISAIVGVTSVKAVAATGQVTVVSEAALDEEAVRAAVDEAGYELVGKAA